MTLHHSRSGRVFAGAAAAALVAYVFGLATVRVDAQPPAAANARQHGKAIYDARCVECHGASGHGDGPAGPWLMPRPRDFTTGRYKLRSTETGSLPTDDDLIQSVKQGLYATAMLGWQFFLRDADVRDVVEYVKSFSPRFANEQPQPVSMGAPIAPSPESHARGQQVYLKLQCGKCHGIDGRGTEAVAKDFQDDSGQPLRAADLTETWTFRGGATSRDVYLRFRTGMSGTPMPSFKESATEAEMWDLANYVVSLGRKPIWSMNAQEIVAHYAREDAEAKSNPVKRGGYLVETLGCALCHSPSDENKRMLPGMRLAGGMLFRIEPYGDFPTGNLTSDKETGLGNWTDDEIKGTITKGILRDGTRLLPYPMDYASFSTMSADDLNAIVAYLRTVPPISNRVPKPSFKFLPFFLWGKFNMLILGGDPPMAFFPGNAGTPGGRP